MWNWAKEYALSPVMQSFATPFFFVISSICLTYAPIFNRSMQMLWMQQNILCIAAATFKMIPMSSARSASTLSALRSNQKKLEWKRPHLSRLLWTYGVFQIHTTRTSCKWGNLPAFLRHFTEERHPLVSPTRDSESILSSVRLTVWLDNKTVCDRNIY